MCVCFKLSTFPICSSPPLPPPSLIPFNILCCFCHFYFSSICKCVCITCTLFSISVLTLGTTKERKSELFISDSIHLLNIIISSCFCFLANYITLFFLMIENFPLCICTALSLSIPLSLDT